MDAGSGQSPGAESYLGMPIQGLSFELPPDLFGSNNQGSVGQSDAMGGNLFQLASETSAAEMPAQNEQSSRLPSPDTMRQQMHSRVPFDNLNPIPAPEYPPPFPSNFRPTYVTNQLNPPYNLMGWVYPPLVQPTPNSGPTGPQYPPAHAVPNPRPMPPELQQHLARTRPPVIYSPATFRYRNHGPYPQVGGASGVRRHHRSSSSQGPTASVRQPSARNSTNIHRQNRPPPVNDARQSTPSHPSRDHQPSPPVYRPNRLELARQLHMEANEIRAREMRLYHQAIVQSHNRYDDLDIDGPSPLPRSLDSKHDGRPEPKETDDLTVNMECKICMSQLVDTVMLPCGHAILCRWCAEQHMPSGPDRTRPKGKALCPVCRGPVKYKFRIFLS